MVDGEKCRLALVENNVVVINPPHLVLMRGDCYNKLMGKAVADDCRKGR